MTFGNFKEQVNIKFLKRGITIIAALFVALVLVACTDDTPTDTSVDDPNDNESEDVDPPHITSTV